MPGRAWSPASLTSWDLKNHRYGKIRNTRPLNLGLHQVALTRPRSVWERPRPRRRIGGPWLVRSRDGASPPWPLR